MTNRRLTKREEKRTIEQTSDEQSSDEQGKKARERQVTNRRVTSKGKGKGKASDEQTNDEQSSDEGPAGGMKEKSKEFSLEDRLIDFAVRIVQVAESLPKTKTGNHIAGQLIKCGTSPAPNYGEAQDAESRADFIHKIKVVLKELRETRTWLLMTLKAQLVKPPEKLYPLIDENNQLIAIFVSSVKTARQNSNVI